MTVEWYGGELVAKVNAETIKALGVAAEMVLAKAQEVCPVAPDGGTLKGSGTQNPTNGGKTREVSFNTPYAHWIHEGGEGWNWSKAGTGPKYLETPLRENADKVLKYLNEATARALGG